MSLYTYVQKEELPAAELRQLWSIDSINELTFIHAKSSIGNRADKPLSRISDEPEVIIAQKTYERRETLLTKTTAMRAATDSALPESAILFSRFLDISPKLIKTIIVKRIAGH